MSIVLHRMVVVVVMALRGVSGEGLRFADAVKGITLVAVEAV
jgi:hypothetical protein